MSVPSRKFRITIATLAVAGLIAAPLTAHADEAPAPAAPKNIILLISDGAGHNQFDIANFYETGAGYSQVNVDPATGTVEHIPGTPNQVYESWPVQVSQSTHSANGRGNYTTENAWEGFGWVSSGATDSAAAGTALGTGVKTRNGQLGFDADGERLLTVGEQAKEVGKKVGLVSSVPFNHATPAGFIAHNQSRNDYHGLASEMIDSGVDVIMGGGHPNFNDNGSTRVPNHTWISQGDFGRLLGGDTEFSYLETRSDFEALTTGDTPEKVFGLAQVAETLQYNRSGLGNKNVQPFTDPAVANVPTLETMTKGALNVLDNGEDGFFLMVEGGAIDWAGHANQTTRVLEEQIDFNNSVDAVNNWVEANSSWDETLVIVTADHETGYLSGPGANPGWTAMTGTAGELPSVSWHSGGHTNTVVPFYAKGAGADQFRDLADEWDLVRGAYLDNTEIGEAIFDFLGHAPAAEGGDAVAVEAVIPVETTVAGSLSLTVAPAAPVVLADGTTGTLPDVTVNDTRNEVQALGKGWSVVGAADDFSAGNRTLAASAMSWSPAIAASDAGAAAGPQANFEGPVTLAQADRQSRVGTTVATAELALDVPADARSGRYGTEITLSLFAQD